RTPIVGTGSRAGCALRGCPDSMARPRAPPTRMTRCFDDARATPCPVRWLIAMVRQMDAADTATPTDPSESDRTSSAENAADGQQGFVARTMATVIRWALS